MLKIQPAITESEPECVVESSAGDLLWKREQKYKNTVKQDTQEYVGEESPEE